MHLAHPGARRWKYIALIAAALLAITAALFGTARPAHAATYPNHTNIVATTFWVGEVFNANTADGSQVCSTYDTQWGFSYLGFNDGTVPTTAAACGGSYWGACDGVDNGATTYATFTCATEARTAANNYFPTQQPTPSQNPFYLDLPYDDLNNATAFANRCTDIPWATAVDPTHAHCADSTYSYMKNRWVALTGPNGHTCYGQIEDAGPGQYDDTNYVFGSADARPLNTLYSGDPTQGAGADVSPALNSCLGFTALNGDTDHVGWTFVDNANVPAGPWTQVVTTTGVQ